MTNGRTGDDIRKLVKKAADWPFEKILKADHLKKAPTLLYCLDLNCKAWHICSEDAEGAKPMTWKEVYQNNEEVCIPAITFNDLLTEMKDLAPSVSPAMLKTFVDYGKSINMPISEPYAFK